MTSEMEWEGVCWFIIMILISHIKLVKSVLLWFSENIFYEQVPTELNYPAFRSL